MALAFAVLASGSLGNCTVVRTGDDRHLLIDAGLGRGTTAGRLETLGAGLEDVRDVLLTHLDHDHFHRGWPRLLDEHEMTFHVHRRHQRRATACGIPARRLEVFDDEPFELPGISVRSALVAHDNVGAVAYVIERDGVRLGLATDLGRVTRSLLEAFDDLHALAMESNYDPALQRTSDRPDFLKARIMSGQGHLSNEQALEAVLDIAARSRLRHVALLHLSRDCNDPGLVKRLYARRAPELLDILTITSQHRPTALLPVTSDAPPPRRGQQMGLGFR